jgi:hypothetical protein
MGPLFGLVVLERKAWLMEKQINSIYEIISFYVRVKPKNKAVQGQRHGAGRPPRFAPFRQFGP